LTAAGNIENHCCPAANERRSSIRQETEEPIDKSFNWLGSTLYPNTIKRAINLSMGFGGLYSAVCVEKI
jgi:malonyl-ACP decarboxylase